MALVHSNNTVQTTPTLIAAIPVGVGQSKAVQIFNGGAVSIFLGDITVSASGATIGRPILAGGSFQLWLNGGDKIYAIATVAVAAGSVVVTYSA